MKIKTQKRIYAIKCKRLKFRGMQLAILILGLFESINHKKRRRVERGERQTWYCELSCRDYVKDDVDIALSLTSSSFVIAETF